MPFAFWDEVRGELATALGNLSDSEFLVLGEPAPQPATRRPLFGRRTGPTPTLYVQVLRVEDVLSAECVGATTLGGTWDMGEDTIEILRALGWQTPAESRAAWGKRTPNFDLFVELTSSQMLADLLVVTLRLLGAQPEQLSLETSSGAARALEG